MRISDPKNFQNFKFCKLSRPVWANLSIDIHEIYKFHAPMGSTKTFQIWCHSVPNWGVIGRKPQSGNFHQTFRGPLAQKLWIRSEKVTGCKNETDVLYAHAKLDGDRWTHGDRRWKTMMFFVCMFVFLYVCHAGCAVKRSGRSTTYYVTSCRSILMRFSLFFTERNELSNLCKDFNYVIRWRHNVRQNRRKF